MASYVSSAEQTELVLVQSKAGIRPFGRPLTIGSWQIGRQDICAPHPPDCTPEQTFIGDYIGLVATPHRVTVAYIAPALPDTENRMLVSALPVR